MSDFQSYQHYQAPATESVPEPINPRINAEAGTTVSVVSINGQTFTEMRGVEKMTADELNPRYQDGSVFATAKSALGGIGVGAIKPDTLITINGVQATCQTFENAGLIHRDARGEYQEGSGRADEPQEAPQAHTEGTADAVEMPSEIQEGVNRALDGVEDQQLVPLVASGIAVATGELDISRLEAQLSNFSGVSKEEAASRVAFMQEAYQAQADTAVTSRCGISAEDLPAFWAYCKESRQLGSLRDALNLQVHKSSMSGYRALADRFLSDNPPSLAAVVAAGMETRQLGDRAEVLIEGRWLPLATAAKLGYI